jgi:hypothetical protein
VSLADELASAVVGAAELLAAGADSDPLLAEAVVSGAPPVAGAAVECAAAPEDAAAVDVGVIAWVSAVSETPEPPFPVSPGDSGAT